MAQASAAQKMSQPVNATAKKSDNNAEARQTQNKRMSAGGGALVMLIAVIILLIAAGVMVFLNVGDSRMMLVGLLQSADPVVGQEFDAFSAEREALAAQRSELDQAAAGLEAERAALKTKETQLSKRERTLMDAEADAQIDAENMAKAAEERERMITVLTKLDAKSAATILTGLQDPREIVDLLMVFKEKFAAQVLLAMDPAVATRVVQEALNRNADAAFLQGLPFELLPDPVTPTPTPMPQPTPAPLEPATKSGGGGTASATPDSALTTVSNSE